MSCKLHVTYKPEIMHDKGSSKQIAIHLITLPIVKERAYLTILCICSFVSGGAILVRKCLNNSVNFLDPSNLNCHHLFLIPVFSITDYTTDFYRKSVIHHLVLDLFVRIFFLCYMNVSLHFICFLLVTAVAVAVAAAAAYSYSQQFHLVVYFSPLSLLRFHSVFLFRMSFY